MPQKRISAEKICLKTILQKVHCKLWILNRNIIYDLGHIYMGMWKTTLANLISKHLNIEDADVDANKFPIKPRRSIEKLKPLQSAKQKRNYR